MSRRILLKTAVALSLAGLLTRAGPARALIGLGTQNVVETNTVTQVHATAVAHTHAHAALDAQLATLVQRDDRA